MRATVIVLLLAAPALAEPPQPAQTPQTPQTIDEQRRELAILVPHGGPGFHARGFAQLAAGAADRRMDGDFAIGGELRLAATRCDFVRAGGQARLGWSDGTRTSAEQWASACLPIEPMMLELGHHLEWDVRPALLAQLELRRGANRRETLTMQSRSVILDGTDLFDSTGEIDLLDARADVSWLWSADGEVEVAPQQVIEGVLIRYRRPQLAPWGQARDYSVDVFGGGGELVGDGFALRAWLLRIANLRLGPAYVTGGLGFADAGVGALVNQYDHEVQVRRTRGELAIESGEARWHGHIRATREVGLVADGFVTVDNRVTAGVALELASTRFAVDAALASTQIHARQRSPRTGGTGGAALAAIHRLTSYLHATARLDVAKSFYAPGIVDGMDDLAPRWAVQVLAAIQATAGN